MKQIYALLILLLFGQIINAQQKADSLKPLSWPETASHTQFNEGVISDPLQLILGKVPGAEVFKSGSDPNVASSLMVRGNYGLYSQSGPLYVIDGIVGGDLFLVPPREIESIKILKNFAETSFYGIEGSNGVVLVNTKSGSANKKLSITFNPSVSLSQTRGLRDLLTADGMREQAHSHDELIFHDGGAGTNWQDELFRSTVTQSYQLALGGTLKNTNYRVSFNHIDQPGNVMGSSRNVSGGSVKILQTGLKKKLRVSGLVSYYLTKSHVLDYPASRSGENLFYQVFNYNPTDPVYTPGGSYNQANRVFQYYNPLALDNMISNNEKTDQLSAVLNADWEVWKGLGIKFTASYNDNKTGTLYNRQEGAYPNATPYTKEGKDTYTRTDLLAGLTYKRHLGIKHFLDIFAGYMFRSSAREDELSIYYSHSPTGDYSLDKIKYKDYGLRATVNYNFRQKYYLGLVVNQEHAQSNATPEYNGTTLGWGQWAFYPGITASWEISREGFMKKIKPISTLVLKGSYGTAGARPKDQYISLDNTGYKNKELWIEKTTEITAGLDLGFIRNRILAEIEYYNRNTGNAIYPQPLPVPPNLFPYSYRNGMKVNNSGIEIKLMSRVIDKDQMKWNSILCFSKNKNKVVSVEGQSSHYSGNIDYYFYQTNLPYVLTTTSGHSILAYNLPVFLAYYQGQPVYERKGGGYTNSVDQANRQINDLVFPDYILSWTNSFTLFRYFDLSLMFRYVSGHHIFNGTRVFLSDPTHYLTLNTLPEAEANYTAGVTRLSFSDMYLENASYLRLENLSVGYTFIPKESKWKGSLRIYLAASNLFTLTGYTGLDPEFNYNSPGIDYFNTYPKSRVYTLGISLEI